MGLSLSGRFGLAAVQVYGQQPHLVHSDGEQGGHERAHGDGDGGDGGDGDYRGSHPPCAHVFQPCGASHWP